MKIAFIHDWQVHWQQEYDWRDGLCAAIRELGKEHEVKFWVCGEKQIIPHPYFPIHVSNDIVTEVREFNPDKIIIWGDTTRPHARALAPLGKPMALCFAGGHFDGDARNYIDHYFVESEVYKGRFEAQGCSVSTAFGTNTELFQPIPAQHKLFDALFPATFALWKRHSLFAEATKGLKACAVGFMYETHEQECWQVCEQAGNLVLPHVSAEALRHLYAASKCVVIPSRADGGSQRTVLEAMSMNIPVVVCGDSDKTSEYLRGQYGYIVAPNASDIRKVIEDNTLDLSTINTRDYILSKWSEKHYAEAMNKWIKS